MCCSICFPRTHKADRVEELLIGGGTISVQVLNEFAAVASRKLSLSWGEIKDILGPIRAICEVDPVSIETHDRAIEIAGRYRFSFYDSAIVIVGIAIRAVLGRFPAWAAHSQSASDQKPLMTA